MLKSCSVKLTRCGSDEVLRRTKNKTLHIHNDNEYNENNFQSNDNVHPVVKFKYDLKTVIINSNHNLERRLHLDCLPHCLMNIDKCMSKHGCRNNFNFISHDLHIMLSLFLNSNEYVEACTYLQFCLIQINIIPTESVLCQFLQLILDVCDIDDDSTSKHFILELIEDYFVSLFLLYPPHKKNMLQYYKKLFTMPINSCKHKDHGNYESFNGMFSYCINRIQNELSSENISDKSSIDGTLIHNNTEMDTFPNFKSIIDKSFENYDSFSKDEKISRLYILLRIIAKCFEDDLAFKMLLCNKENNIHSKFLVSQIIWDKVYTQNFGFMTLCVRKIINILVLSVRNNRKKSECAVIVKLLGVIASTLNLMSESGRLILGIREQLDYLAIEISVAIQGEEAPVVIRVLSLLQPCFLKNLVANRILNLVHRTTLNNGLNSYNITYEYIFEQKLWTSFPKKGFAYDNISMLDMSGETVSLQLSQGDYLSILGQAFYSFVKMYDLEYINPEHVHHICGIVDEKCITSTNEDRHQIEVNLFKKYYRRHVDLSQSFKHYTLLSKSHVFDYVMQLRKNVQIKQLIEKYSYLPAISWVTGYFYYKKYLMYIHILHLIEKLKSEQNENIENVIRESNIFC